MQIHLFEYGMSRGLQVFSLREIKSLSQVFRTFDPLLIEKLMWVGGGLHLF